MARMLLALGFAAVTIWGPAVVSAVPLSQLIDQDLTIVSGTKVFSDFSGNIVTAGCPPGTCAPLLLSGIDVSPFTDASGNFGIRIQANAAVVNNNVVVLPGQVSHDVVLGYTVTSTAGLITDVILSAVAAVQGDASFSVIESFDGSQIAVFIPPGPNTAIAFPTPPVQSVDVIKDIGLLANGCPVGVVCANTASWSVIDQTFSQGPASSAGCGSIVPPLPWCWCARNRLAGRSVEGPRWWVRREPAAARALIPTLRGNTTPGRADRALRRRAVR